MSQLPGRRGEAGDYRYERSPAGAGFFQFLQQPRIVLILLAGWEVLGFLTQFFISTPLLLENHNQGDIAFDGALAGRAFGWESIPLAALYIYCARDPGRYPRVFILAMIEQAALIAANLYHLLITQAFTFESALIPIIGAAVLGLLSFMNAFEPREREPRLA